jgi:cytochrome c peroxidase
MLTFWPTRVWLGTLAAVSVMLLTRAVAAQPVNRSPTPLPWPDTPSAAPAYARAAAIATVGGELFSDVGLSASGRMSCATCHDPAHGFGPTNAMPVQLGGPSLDKPGTRAVPGLTYSQFSPFFTEHYYESEDDGDGSTDQGPTGGRTWDGRVNRARDQAAIPLLASNEMANRSATDVVARVAASSHAGELKQLYGDDLFTDPHRAFAAITEALEFYQQTPGLFSPFSSKYDAFLSGQVQLTEQEARGLELFNDPDKGNCAHCHKSRPTAGGAPPLFTDYGLVAIGAPRNMTIPANGDPAYHDLGVCGPDRQDLAGRADFCGLFKAPSLRNVALRQTFYHNGVIHSLDDAVAFYATRDTNPERWYPTGPDGKVRKFDDLPAEYQININFEPPFDRQPGDAPALSATEIADIVAFLRTLTDGFQFAPGEGAASRAPTK